MFVIVTTYRAKIGEEDAIVALHEGKGLEAAHHQSWRLLRKADEPREFISIAQFADEKLAQEAMQELQQDEWYTRLMSFMEESPTRLYYTLAWSLH